tara:strand:- start:214 stop:378 length:165 start_codon:yes stop_codon:yes gene_type:complete
MWWIEHQDSFHGLGLGQTVWFLLTDGQDSDITQAPALIQITQVTGAMVVMATTQ